MGVFSVHSPQKPLTITDHTTLGARHLHAPHPDGWTNTTSPTFFSSCSPFVLPAFGRPSGWGPCRTGQDYTNNLETCFEKNSLSALVGKLYTAYGLINQG